MRSIVPLLTLAWLCACTGDLPPADVPTTDGRPAADAAPGADAGGGPDARASVTIDVVCQPYARTVTNASGTRVVTTYRYGIVDSIGPEDDFAVMTCGVVVTPPPEACPAGATCTGSNVPPGEACSRTYRGGGFIDGKLMVNCGYSFESFAADGTLTNSTSYSYASIRVITY